jgi:catechol 2,3-dioxygenase-like lactoylglutathione lyase family enzyme
MWTVVDATGGRSVEAALNLLVIRSADLERAARFYGALGVRLVRERHGTGPEHLAGPAGAVVLEVYPKGSGGDTLGVRLGFRVASVSAVVAEVLTAGGSLVSPPQDSPWGLRAVVVDPDGHRVEVVEEPRHGNPA